MNEIIIKLGNIKVVDEVNCSQRDRLKKLSAKKTNGKEIK